MPKKKQRGDDDDDGGKGIVHDDVWCLDLKALRGWVCVRADSRGEAAFEASDWETDEDGEGGDDDEEGAP